jgi:hypothetical protein
MNVNFIMSYIVPFLLINSILIDVCFINVMFYGSIFYSYNSFYLLSNLNYFTLHFSIIFLVIYVIIILVMIFMIFMYLSSLLILIIINCYCTLKLCSYLLFSYYLLLVYINFSFNSNCIFSGGIFVDFFLILSTFFFKGIVNITELFTSVNLCYGILFNHFLFSLIQIQFILLFLVIV